MIYVFFVCFCTRTNILKLITYNCLFVYAYECVYISEYTTQKTTTSTLLLLIIIIATTKHAGLHIRISISVGRNIVVKTYGNIKDNSNNQK